MLNIRVIYVHTESFLHAAAKTIAVAVSLPVQKYSVCGASVGLDGCLGSASTSAYTGTL